MIKHRYGNRYLHNGALEISYRGLELSDDLLLIDFIFTMYSQLTDVSMYCLAEVEVASPYPRIQDVASNCGYQSCFKITNYLGCWHQLARHKNMNGKQLISLWYNLERIIHAQVRMAASTLMLEPTKNTLYALMNSRLAGPENLRGNFGYRFARGLYIVDFAGLKGEKYPDLNGWADAADTSSS
ncbi:hypothetical protein T4E_8163 [Trichinella pseudospiralis]|uniref:Uncharacterized protein n=1 Tax=Trichinella pseudospiralis TaxID=6337 RepID=A0A0V0XVR4_TRIPS|nr:hypothetical protein T4E_8163 [Trichinella pseudospiralis]